MAKSSRMMLAVVAALLSIGVFAGAGAVQATDAIPPDAPCDMYPDLVRQGRCTEDGRFKAELEPYVPPPNHHIPLIPEYYESFDDYDAAFKARLAREFVWECAQRGELIHAGNCGVDT